MRLFVRAECAPSIELTFASSDSDFMNIYSIYARADYGRARLIEDGHEPGPLPFECWESNMRSTPVIS